MNYLQLCTDLHRPSSDLELFAIALVLRHIRALIRHGGSDMRRRDDDSALHPHHLEAFLARAVERTWKDKHMAQEWYRLQLFLPRLKEAWERGRTLFQEDLDQAKGKEYIEYFSMIEFAVDCFTDVFASRFYPDNTMLRDWAIIGYMLVWRGHFLKDQDREVSTEVGL
jgi:hypothetical protein